MNEARRAISQSNEDSSPARQAIQSNSWSLLIVLPFFLVSSLASPLREKKVWSKRVTVEVERYGQAEGPESARLAKNVAYPTTL